MMFGEYLTGGAPMVIDCVGSESSLSDALKVVAPGGTVLVVGMPGHTNLDLTTLGIARARCEVATPTPATTSPPPWNWWTNSTSGAW